MIKKMGFSEYFLIVWDFVRFAKERNIRVGPVSYTHLDVYKRQVLRLRSPLKRGTMPASPSNGFLK